MIMKRLILLFTLMMCYIYNDKIIETNMQLFLFPISRNTYWFITMWLFVYIFSPLLNIIITNIDKKYIRIYLLFSLSVWCIIPSFFTVNYYYSILLYCFFLYIIGAAFKLKIIKFDNYDIKMLIRGHVRGIFFKIFSERIVKM